VDLFRGPDTYGAAWALCLVGILSIGLFVLPVARLATVLLARDKASLSGLPDLVSGVALPPLYLAAVNRSGPGLECRATAEASNCTQEYSPLPFLFAGLALLGAAVTVFVSRFRKLGGC